MAKKTVANSDSYLSRAASANANMSAATKRQRARDFASGVAEITGVRVGRKGIKSVDPMTAGLNAVSLVPGLGEFALGARAARVGGKLLPAGGRIASAAIRLKLGSAAAWGERQFRAGELIRSGQKMTAKYYDDVQKARRALGYEPGEAVQRAVAGTERYSGSSYRVGRGIPEHVPDTRRAASSMVDEGRRLERVSAGYADMTYGQVEKTIKSRLKSFQSVKRGRRGADLQDLRPGPQKTTRSSGL